MCRFAIRMLRGRLQSLTDEDLRAAVVSHFRSRLYWIFLTIPVLWFVCSRFVSLRDLMVTYGYSVESGPPFVSTFLTYKSKLLGRATWILSWYGWRIVSTRKFIVVMHKILTRVELWLLFINRRVYYKPINFLNGIRLGRARTTCRLINGNNRTLPCTAYKTKNPYRL